MCKRESVGPAFPLSLPRRDGMTDPALRTGASSSTTRQTPRSRERDKEAASLRARHDAPYSHGQYQFLVTNYGYRKLSSSSSWTDHDSKPDGETKQTMLIPFRISLRRGEGINHVCCSMQRWCFLQMLCCAFLHSLQMLFSHCSNPPFLRVLSCGPSALSRPHHIPRARASKWEVTTGGTKHNQEKKKSSHGQGGNVLTQTGTLPSPIQGN